MGLDVRLPVGLLFSAIGAALVLYGLTSNPAIYAKSLGYNVNLWWGLVLLVFGVLMLLLGWSDAPLKRSRSAREAPGGEETVVR